MMKNQNLKQTNDENFTTVREDVTRALGTLATLMENTDDYNEFKRLKTKRGALGDVLNTMEDMEKAGTASYSALFPAITELKMQDGDDNDAYNSGINLALDYVTRLS